MPNKLDLISELANRNSENGFVYLDTSLIRNGNISILASSPSLILEGDFTNIERLKHELEERKTESSSLEDGLAIGYFRFDGSFCFGFYDQTSTICVHNPIAEELQSFSKNKISLGKFESNLTSKQFIKSVYQAQREITLGNIYQVCLSHRLSTYFYGNPWFFYLKLRSISPAPYSAYIKLNNETILSSSPECFLKMNGRDILTEPIKGTRPRGKNCLDDQQEAQKLKSSIKEQAELLMITDLERNDLGKICEYGTVTTPQLVQFRKYSHVFHLISQVQGKLKPSISHLESLLHCFPGGSISGAPKKRAIEIITDLETVPRGIFTGVIGYFGYSENSQFNIAIRTITIHKNIAHFSVGAGITADSIPEEEWEETWHKAAGILETANFFTV